MSFDLPPATVVAFDAVGIDSCVGDFRPPASRISSDYGAFLSSVSTFAETPHVDVVQWTEVVDGRTVSFVTSRNPSAPLPFVAAMATGNLQPGEPWPRYLVMMGSSGTEADRDDVLAVLRSVDFAF